MSRNTVEIILMCVVLVVLMIGMVFVIKTKYMPEVEDVDDYSYEESLEEVENKEVENTTAEVQTEVPVENNVEETETPVDVTEEETEQ